MSISFFPLCSVFYLLIHKKILSYDSLTSSGAFGKGRCQSLGEIQGHDIDWVIFLSIPVFFEELE